MVAQPIGHAVRQRLEAIADLAVADDDHSRVAASGDFGGLARGSVRAVVRPGTDRALVDLVQVAREEGISLTPRGLGLSQSGQSVARDGVSVDLSAFGGVYVDPARARASCGGAVTWRQLLSQTAQHGLAPAVMPFNLDLSIGGTLSAGGLGSTSHRYGLAVSSVETATVVTGSGELCTASVDSRREVYDAVLGGVGQFGFITRVLLRLRRMNTQTRTFHLLYDDFDALLSDQLALMSEPGCAHLEGFAAAAVQGVRKGPGGRRVPFARWFPGLQVSAEFEPAAEPDRGFLEHLHHRELVHVEDSESVEFAARYDSRFEMMRAVGAWDQAHPWLECMLPFDSAMRVVPALVPELPLVLGDGHRIMPVADVEGPDLLMRPRGQPTIGLAILPMSIPPPFQPIVMTALKSTHERLLDAGGKRYLSGWLFEPDDAAWRRHFGPKYETWRARKRELDPDGVLASVLFRP